MKDRKKHLHIVLCLRSVYSILRFLPKERKLFFLNFFCEPPILIRSPVTLAWSRESTFLLLYRDSICYLSERGIGKEEKYFQKCLDITQIVLDAGGG